MPENYSRVMEPPRAADVREHPETRSEFVAREKCLLEEGRELQDGWSFIERLYGFPFWQPDWPRFWTVVSASMLALSFPVDLFGVAVVFTAVMAGMLAAAAE
jgi:hypothetical protein